MDPEPKALRPYVILSTAFVLLGAIAGFALFLQQRAAPSRDVTIADDAALDAVVIRPMEPPASLDAATRARVAASVEVLISAPGATTRRAAGEALRDVGLAAVPSLLDGLHRVATAPDAFEDPDVRARLIAADLALARIRLAATPESPADPFRRAPDAAWCVRRVKYWFHWWERYTASHPDWR